jgi:3'-5' exoribonuclease
MAIDSLRSGDDFSGVLACTRKDRLMARSGSPYLALELRDASGALPARAFRDADLLAGRFERGDLVRVAGRVERFRDELQLEVRAIARAPEGAADPADFLPSLRRDPDELDGFLEHLGREVCDRRLAPLVQGVLGDDGLRAALRRAPCGRDGHHAYLGGLLEHTVAVATLAYETCQVHPRLDSDLLIAAAIVHDLGRTAEFTYGAEIAQTEEGRLLGHLALGQRVIDERARGMSPERRAALLHCVLSHHGTSGGRFQSAEALALYRLNALDAGVHSALGALSRRAPEAARR